MLDMLWEESFIQDSQKKYNYQNESRQIQKAFYILQ